MSIPEIPTQAKAVRDQGERLLEMMKQSFTQAEADAARRTDLGDSQRLQSRRAMDDALTLALQMVESLDQANVASDPDNQDFQK